MSGVKKVLIVEDEISLQKLLANKLTEDGYKTLTAEDGEAGLEIAEKEKPDLILLDIVLPRMDGMTFLEKIREEDWGKKVPVIILTNLTDDSRVQTAKDNKVFDYLVKTDWSLDDVSQKVKEKLGD